MPNRRRLSPNALLSVPDLLGAILHCIGGSPPLWIFDGLVDLHVCICGYRRLSLIRASCVVNRQSTAF